MQPSPEPAEVVAAQTRSHYWRGQVKPRVGRIVGSPEFFVPILVGLILPWAVEPAAAIHTPIADVAGFAMNYAAIGFGACITGSVLAISLPSKDRIGRWAQTQTGRGFSAYGDLVFALTWAAFAHLALIGVCVASIVIGDGENLLPGNPKETHTVLLSLSVAVFFYALVQLLVLLQTISQLGNLIDYQERQQAPQSDLETG